MKSSLLILFLFSCILSTVHAQVAKTQVVQVGAVANANGTITLTWPAEVYTGNFDIYRRNNPNVEDWGTAVGTLPGNQNSFTDNTAQAGDAWEYMVVKRIGATTEALGYIFAGNKAELQNRLEAVLLVTDSNYKVPLNTEIARLKSDLEHEGYDVIEILAGRTEGVSAVKSRIVNAYDQATRKPTVLFLLGHIPVPYSGYFSANGTAPPPDGHVEGSGNHTGAWPADVYYGVLENLFTDTWVNCTTGSQTRNHNVPGDGKFDQTKLPAYTNLEVGRVDLFNMPVFGKSDTVLMRNYLNRDHAWRTGQYKMDERALIDNNFGTLNLASTGYSNFAGLVGSANVFDNRDYFTAQKSGSYLWSYGCGAGSYTSCSGVGVTSNFNNDSFQNTFTILAGSYFGDWDVQNSFLRGPLGSSSLASFWGGIPKWYVHHMGLGERIGKGVRLTQNNTTFYYSGNFNSSSFSVHIALMGDPTLKMRNLSPVTGLQAVSENKTVKLNWNRSADPTLEYFIYVTDPVTNKLIRIHSDPISDTFYVDTRNYYSGIYHYTVRTVRLETSASGTYYNTGGGETKIVNHVNAVDEMNGSQSVWQIYPNPQTNNSTLNLEWSQRISGTAQVTLYSLNGQEMLRQDLGSVSAGNQHYTLQHELPAGFYLVKLQTADGEWNARLLVQ